MIITATLAVHRSYKLKVDHSWNRCALHEWPCYNKEDQESSAERLSL